MPDHAKFSQPYFRSLPSDIELSGEAKAELSELLKQLADLGVQGSIQYKDQKYQGVLQDELARAISEGDNCRLNVVRKLNYELITSPREYNLETQPQHRCYPGLDCPDDLSTDHRPESEQPRPRLDVPVPKPAPVISKKDFNYFPWPPPLASATEVIPRKLLVRKSKATRLQDVDHKLTEAIEQNGYYESSYYAVFKGFALATRMEQIESDGSSKKELQRWNLEYQSMDKFSLTAYLKALLFASPGYYRVIVFIVSPVPLTQSSSAPTLEEAKKWLSSGYNHLPDDIGNLKFSPTYTCTALIYEFERASESDEPHFRQPGRIPGHTHLMKAGVWASLQQ